MKMKLEAILGITALIAICAAGSSVYAVYWLSDLGARVEGLEEMMVPTTVGVTFDYGDDNVRTETITIMVGATALNALEKIATVEKTYYPQFETYFIDSIDGVANDPDAGYWWTWDIWNEDISDWEHASVGAGVYHLKSGDNIRFILSKY
jgi:hypothetical protein